jgi:hypothetical protein
MKKNGRMSISYAHQILQYGRDSGNTAALAVPSEIDRSEKAEVTAEL